MPLRNIPMGSVVHNVEMQPGKGGQLARSAGSQVVLAALAKLSPESAGSMGVDGLDEEITDLGPGVYERGQELIGDVVAELETDLESERDAKVRQDLGILIKASKDTLHSEQLQHEYLLPYYNMNQTVFTGIRALIDPQIPVKTVWFMLK